MLDKLGKNSSSVTKLSKKVISIWWTLDNPHTASTFNTKGFMLTGGLSYFQHNPKLWLDPCIWLSDCIMHSFGWCNASRWLKLKKWPPNYFDSTPQLLIFVSWGFPFLGWWVVNREFSVLLWSKPFSSKLKLLQPNSTSTQVGSDKVISSTTHHPNPPQSNL